MTDPRTIAPWHVSGSYFEACNCDPICPCRSVGGRPGGRSTHGECFGTLSWHILEGKAGAVVLSGLSVVMSLHYFDDEPGSPWTVILYVDDRADSAQHAALADIFLGRAEGTPVLNYAASIGTVHAVRRARIEVNHTPNHQTILIAERLEVRSSGAFESEEPVACGIPGFGHPGQEVRSDVLRSMDSPLDWDVRDRCGFATDFSYSSGER